MNFDTEMVKLFESSSDSLILALYESHFQCPQKLRLRYLVRIHYSTSPRNVDRQRPIRALYISHSYLNICLNCHTFWWALRIWFE